MNCLEYETQLKPVRRHDLCIMQEEELGNLGQCDTC